MRLPRSVNIAFTLPRTSPSTMLSPTLSVPVCTSTVAIVPRCLSMRASTTTPMAGRCGFAFSSPTSATTITFSSRSVMPSPLSAEIGTAITSPPPSSISRSCSASWRFTRSWSASGLSILLIATTMGTPADFTWSIASIVCGMMPSSAAMTSIAMSVTCAPRARIAVNASWPGVSRKEIAEPSKSIWYAPMCCVMPPASPLTTSLLRSESSSVVLPWSTWPRIVTTGGRDSRRSGSSSSVDTTIEPEGCSGSASGSTSNPNDSATSAAVSCSTTSLMVYMKPLRMNSLMTSMGLSPITSARSWMVMAAGISMA